MSMMDSPSLGSTDSMLTAANHLIAATSELQDQLKSFKTFWEENNELMSLVQELPNKVSHKVMVPFGKAAFFPGSLIHTNEMTVLLGDNVYALRSSTQTAEILGRRADFLGSKIALLESRIIDLELESSFARSSLEEPQSGVVEIKEDYEEGMAWAKLAVGESRNVESRNQEPVQGDGDDEDLRIFARLEELERQEAEEGKVTDALNPWSEVDSQLTKDACERERSGVQSEVSDLNVENKGPNTDSKSKRVQMLDDKTVRRQPHVSFQKPDLEKEASRLPDLEKDEQSANGLPLAPPRSSPSVAQQRAFPGAILERQAKPTVSSVLEVECKSENNLPVRPVSKFKQRMRS